MSTILKATSNGLRQQLQISPSDIKCKVSFVSNILLTVMLCATLKPNGKFYVGLTNIEGIECLECSSFTQERVLLSLKGIYYQSLK